MLRIFIWRKSCFVYNVCVYHVVIMLISSQTSHSQDTDPFHRDTACTRSIDPRTKVEITHVQYRHRFQVTARLQAYPFNQELAVVNSMRFTTLANKFENEVTNELRSFESRNTYQTVVFLFLPYGGTTQIECVVSAEETTLKSIDIAEAMRRIHTRTNVTEFKNLDTIVSNEVKYCLREVIIPPNGTLTWLTTPVDTQMNTIEQCPQGTQFAGKVPLGTRQCLPTSCIKDAQHPEKKVCHGAWQTFHCNQCGNNSVNSLLDQLSNMIMEPNADVLTICQQALNLTNTAEGLNEMGVEAITVIAEFVNSVTPISQQHVKCVTQLIGNVLLLPEDIIETSERSTASASKLLMVLNNLLISASLEEEQLAIVTANLAVGMIDIDVMSLSYQWYSFGSFKNDGILTNNNVELGVHQERAWTGGRDTYVYLFVDEQEASGTRAIFTLHQNDKLYQQASAPENDGFFVTRLNSRIISANTEAVISQPTIYVALQMIDQAGINQTCVSWVPSSNGIFGDWSPQGCTLESITSDGLTICRCDHFGSFALLANIQYTLPPVAEPQPPLAIGIFVIFAAIFCFISFAIVALVFLFVSSLRAQREFQILTILFFDLAIFYLVFAIAINRTELPGGCVLGAAIVYFCLLAAFAWMAASAGNAYEYARQKYIQLKWFVRKAALLAFGIPGSLTILLTATNPDFFFETKYMCFLASDPTYVMGAAFILPLAISIIATILLFIASFVTYPELETLDPDLPTPRIQRLLLRKKRMYVTAVVFGVIFITFVFLLLATYQSSLATQVIFGLVAIAQGISIIWVYCYNDQEIKTAIIQTIKRSKSTEQGSFKPYWSSSKWQNGSEIPHEPTRFLDNMERSAPLTLQHFNPASIPMTDLEKKRLKISINGDAVQVKEAKIMSMSNHEDQAEVKLHDTEILVHNTEMNGIGHVNGGLVIEANGTLPHDTEANDMVQWHEAEVNDVADAEDTV